jgi:hypothetical protein
MLSIQLVQAAAELKSFKNKFPFRCYTFDKCLAEFLKTSTDGFFVDSIAFKAILYFIKKSYKISIHQK